ncbi:hypothetical protein HanXRQr2_Chr07g0308571 [Helianthus annuus]|uniref:Uncharacterized protein n=1 Tax=Helianthus annuus TaxID=4232 RepID=A0A251UCE3_HELAN|nr:hypothetical protein HanXRQr2_Chr07g0308571 [Helianthus annuus]
MLGFIIRKNLGPQIRCDVFDMQPSELPKTIGTDSITRNKNPARFHHQQAVFKKLGNRFVNFIAFFPSYFHHHISLHMT